MKRNREANKEAGTVRRHPSSPGIKMPGLVVAHWQKGSKTLWRAEDVSPSRSDRRGPLVPTPSVGTSKRNRASRERKRPEEAATNPTSSGRLRSRLAQEKAAPMLRSKATSNSARESLPG